jgi:hypothetical protein
MSLSVRERAEGFLLFAEVASSELRIAPRAFRLYAKFLS